jgi:hypothetical protein
LALDSGSSSVSTAMFASGNVSERVVLAAMGDRIPQLGFARQSYRLQLPLGPCPKSSAGYVDIVTTSDHEPAESQAKSAAPTCVCGSWWRLPTLLAVVLIAILLFHNRQNVDASREPAAPVASSGTLAERPLYVTITIEFGGDKPTLWKQIPWSPGMTVRGLLTSASFGTLAEKGRGQSAFLVGIDGVQNEGAGGRNWMYSVNGKRGDRSFAIYQLQPGDDVLWSISPAE